MANNIPADNVVADATTPKWRNLVRQQSERICTLAEDVVLPKNERLSRRTEDVSMRNIEAQYSPHPSTAYLYKRIEHSKYFPKFMILISLIQIILFYSFDRIVMLLLFGYDPHRRHEIWRFVTMMLAHRSSSHLWNNVFMQLCFGVVQEIIHGWKRMSTIYFASVFGGSLCISVLDNVYTVGASSGVYGLLFSHLATLALNWNEMEKKVCGLIALLIYISCDVGFSIYDSLRGIGNEHHISYAGHLGGAISGFLVSILVLRNFKIQQWERRMQKACIGILIAICGFVFIVNIAASKYYVPIEWNFHYGQTYVNDIYDAINKSAILTQRCQNDVKCSMFLLQFLNGTLTA